LVNTNANTNTNTNTKTDTEAEKQMDKAHGQDKNPKFSLEKRLTLPSHPTNDELYAPRVHFC
jgi:hypothetical protein